MPAKHGMSQRRVREYLVPGQAIRALRNLGVVDRAKRYFTERAVARAHRYV